MLAEGIVEDGGGCGARGKGDGKGGGGGIGVDEYGGRREGDGGGGKQVAAAAGELAAIAVGADEPYVQISGMGKVAVVSFTHEDDAAIRALLGIVEIGIGGGVDEIGMLPKEGAILGELGRPAHSAVDRIGDVAAYHQV